MDGRTDGQGKNIWPSDYRQAGHKKTINNNIQQHSHNRLPGCPGQPFPPVGQPKVEPWLPNRATKTFAICLKILLSGNQNVLSGNLTLILVARQGNRFLKRM